MKNLLNRYPLYVSLALCSFMFSCENEVIEESSQDIVEDEIVISQEELISTMAEDKQVQSFISNNEALLSEYDRRYDAMPEAEKEAYNQALKKALDEGKSLSKEFDLITSSELADHYKKQISIATTLKEKYPGLFKLNSDEQFTVKSAVVDKIISSSNAKIDPCHEGYNACSWVCYDNGMHEICYDACWAGYKACKGS